MFVPEIRLEASRRLVGGPPLVALCGEGPREVLGGTADVGRQLIVAEGDEELLDPREVAPDPGRGGGRALSLILSVNKPPAAKGSSAL